MKNITRLALACLLFFACTLSAEQIKKVKIGAVLGLTGVLAEFSQNLKEGILLASEDLRQAGVIDLEIIFEDNEWQVAKSVAAYKRLTEVEKVKTVYVNSSGATLSIKPISEKQKVLLFSLAAHSEIIKNSKYVLRHGGRSDLDAAVVANKLIELAPQKVAVLSLENEWSEHFEKDLIQYLKSKNSKINLLLESHSPTESDFKAILIRLLKSKPDALLINSIGLATANIVIQARQLGFRGKIIANNGLVLSFDALKLLQDRKEDIVYQTYELAPVEFERRLPNKSKIAAAYIYYAYQDVELLGKLIAKFGEDPETIVNNIKQQKIFYGKYGTIEFSDEGESNIITLMHNSIY